MQMERKIGHAPRVAALGEDFLAGQAGCPGCIGCTGCRGVCEQLIEMLSVPEAVLRRD